MLASHTWRGDATDVPALRSGESRQQVVDSGYESTIDRAVGDKFGTVRIVNPVQDATPRRQWGAGPLVDWLGMRALR